MDEKSPNTELKNSNLFLRLLKGNVPLATTYWGYGVLVGILFNCISLAIEYNYFAMEEKLETIILGYYFFVLAYQIFISIAIWNSAGNYKGKKIWAILARIMVVLSVIVTISSFIPTKQSNLDLQEEITYLNHSLPHMLDTETELESITLKEDDIFYNIKLINSSVSEIDIEKFSKSVEPKLKETACNNKEINGFLKRGKNLNYVYKDKEGKIISIIKIKSLDCTSR